MRIQRGFDIIWYDVADRQLEELVPNYLPAISIGVWRACFLAAMIVSFHAVAAGRLDIAGPVGSIYFGQQVKVLPNGNIVVTDPYGFGRSTVYLYSPSGSLISTLNAANNVGQDEIAIFEIYVLPSSNFVVCSSAWRTDDLSIVGAAILVNGTTGLDGDITADNSLHGVRDGDDVCFGGVRVLASGDYVVSSPYWSDGVHESEGAATWCSGVTGCTGTVTPVNSLVGSSVGDMVSLGNGPDESITELTNGNYVVSSPFWSYNGTQAVGAVTLCSGAGGCSGVVSPTNSLIGSSYLDQVGNTTWGRQPPNGVAPLANGNFVVASVFWHNADGARVGAMTFVNGSTGLVGPVSPANSLVGSTQGDMEQSDVTALSNGNYVVSSPLWDIGAVSDVGAVTWCDGTSGCVGMISAANSLIGTSAGDQVGTIPATALLNGSYVATSPYWSSGGKKQVGAVTLCNLSTGCIGTVTASNSLTGVKTNDEIGSEGVTALTNGNYVVNSPNFFTSDSTLPGAATWCDGTVGCTGHVTSGNSLVGAFPNDPNLLYGPSVSTIALTNGNYVVYMDQWAVEVTGGFGALTWGNGSTGQVGTVDATNSIVGVPWDLSYGIPRLSPAPNGGYVLNDLSWQNGSLLESGLITWLDGSSAQSGAIDMANSALGNVASEGQVMSWDYDSTRSRLAVGKPEDEIVTILMYADELFTSGFE